MREDVTEAKESASSNGDKIQKLHLCMERQHAVRQAEEKATRKTMWLIGVVISVSAIVIPIAFQLWVISRDTTG